MDGLRVKFVKVCKWFEGCDRLKVIFKNCHYISLTYRRKKYENV